MHLTTLPGQGQHDPVRLLCRRPDPEASDARAVRTDHASTDHAGPGGALDGGFVKGADGRVAFQGTVGAKTELD